jgi:predicted dehydrogenase
VQSDKLRVGLVGLGGVAIGHLEGYREVEEIAVVAGADLVTERAREIGERYGFAPYTDYLEMMDRERLDIVAVLSTVNSHREIVEAAADRNIHVLCEKPLAVTTEDADHMIAHCEARGVKLFYAASYRFLPPVVAAQRLIAAGGLGEVQLVVETLLGGSGLSGYQPMSFAHYPKGGPGGSGWGLMDHGIHLVDVFTWLVGHPVEGVYGRGQISGEPPGTEFLVLEYRNGAVGQLIYQNASWSTDLPAEGLFSWAPEWDELVSSSPGSPRGGRWQEQPGNIRVYGTEGSLRIFHYGNRLFLRDRKGLRELALPHRPMPAQFGAEMASFARSVVRDEPPEVPARIGREALRIVLAGYESMRQKRRVEL